MIQEKQNIPVIVSENDHITGSKTWDGTRTTNELNESGWDLNDRDLDKLQAGETVKVISPNGRRIIFVKKA